TNRSVVHTGMKPGFGGKFKFKLAARTPVAVVRSIRAVDRLELLETPTTPDRHAGERRLGAVRGHQGLIAEALVEALQQRAAAADVDDHVAGRLADRQAGADRGRHRLLDQIRLARAGGQAGLLDRALLDAGDAGRHADDDARVRPAVLVDLLDEVAQHLLGDVEVGDHAVLQRADGLDRARRAAEHALRLDADGVDLSGARVDRDHGRLAQHDAAPADVD